MGILTVLQPVIDDCDSSTANFSSGKHRCATSAIHLSSREEGGRVNIRVFAVLTRRGNALVSRPFLILQLHVLKPTTISSNT